MIMDVGHKIPFRGVWDLSYVGIDEELRFEEGLVLVVVVSLV